MSRSTQLTVLAFSGLTLLLAVVSAVFGSRIALGAAAITGACAVSAALLSTVAAREQSHQGTGWPVATPRPSVDTVPAQMPAAAAALAPAPEAAPALTMPVCNEPEAVLWSLLLNAAGAGVAVGAHLWLEDVGTPTLRLICAQGPASPDSTPVSSSEGALGAALASGAARCERLQQSAGGDSVSAVVRWRYAHPFGTDEASGVVGVDFAGDAEPDSTQMARVCSALEGPLMGCLALHIARADARSARELLDTAAELSRLLDPDDVIRAALRHALKLSGAETGSVMLLDDDGAGMRIIEAQGLPDHIVSDTLVSEGEGIAGWVLASSRPLVVEDLEHKGPQSRRHGVLSAASVPIADDDGVLGVLNVGSRRFHARFTRSHVKALEFIGRSLATALRNARAAAVSQELLFDTLKALALAMETRDPYARGGTARVVELAVALAEAVGLSETDAHALRLAALLHDVGMSIAGDGVALSDRPLSTVEWGMIKMHPRIAAEILSQAPTLRTVIPIVYHHHEHYDGRGYTGGFMGEQIPLGARILSVADAFVAMTSVRPYRAAMSAEQAVSEIVTGAGTQFDPEVVNALVELIDTDAGRFAVHAE